MQQKTLLYGLTIGQTVVKPRAPHFKYDRDWTNLWQPSAKGRWLSRIIIHDPLALVEVSEERENKEMTICWQTVKRGHVGSTKKGLTKCMFLPIFNVGKCQNHPKKTKTYSQCPAIVPTLPQYKTAPKGVQGLGKKALSLNPVLTYNFTNLKYT